ncbi:MAG TPA: pyruvate kinase alpha/beta domain-containing protein [Syntrophales bacterium]|nr:pyruvate kinase alpha/beta domain-containing protein [Syntrophales bacterium]
MSEPSLYQDITCRYFHKPGGKNTKAVLEAVSRRAIDLSIGKVLIATCSGRTAFEALKILDKKIKIIAVTHVTGYAKPDTQELDEKDRRELESQGVAVLTCQHAFGGVGRGVRNKLATYQVDEIIAYSLRIFGQGVKVAIELALMAADAGLVRTDEDIISVGGTAKGVDAALVLQPANSSRFFDMKVKEVICKPAMF